MTTYFTLKDINSLRMSPDDSLNGVMRTVIEKEKLSFKNVELTYNLYHLEDTDIICEILSGNTILEYRIYFPWIGGGTRQDLIEKGCDFLFNLEGDFSNKINDDGVGCVFDLKPPTIYGVDNKNTFISLTEWATDSVDIENNRLLYLEYGVSDDVWANFYQGRVIDKELDIEKFEE